MRKAKCAWKPRHYHYSCKSSTHCLSRTKDVLFVFDCIAIVHVTTKQSHTLLTGRTQYFLYVLCHHSNNSCTDSLIPTQTERINQTILSLVESNFTPQLQADKPNRQDGVLFIDGPSRSHFLRSKRPYLDRANAGYRCQRDINWRAWLR